MSSPSLSGPAMSVLATSSVIVQFCNFSAPSNTLSWLLPVSFLLHVKWSYRIVSQVSDVFSITWIMHNTSTSAHPALRITNPRCYNLRRRVAVHPILSQNNNNGSYCRLQRPILGALKGLKIR